MRATAVLKHGDYDTPTDRVVLDYDGRFLRRKRLTTAGGASVMVDLPETISLAQGDALQCDTGEVIVVEAAPEPLMALRGNLIRLAWHIGNRHTPCQIAGDHLLIRHDKVLEKMLKGLGADITHVMAPFTPEGGAYGHGRTMGHDH